MQEWVQKKCPGEHFLPITFYLLPHLYALGGEGVAVVFDEEMAVL